MTDDNIATSQIPLQQSRLPRLWHQRKRLITGFLLSRATRRVPHVVQELLVRPEYLSSRQFLMGCVIFSCQRILFNGLGRLFVVLGYFFYVTACSVFHRNVSFEWTVGCRLFMCYIFVFRSFFYIDKAVSFLVWIVLHCLIGAFYSWLCFMGIAHCWRPYGDL